MRSGIVAACAVLAAAGAAYFFARPEPGPTVILIGLDGAGWDTARRLINTGDLPNLKALADEGATGDLASMSPIVSPRLWTSIASGKLPKKHGIASFTYKTASGRVVPVHAGRRACKTIWNILGDAGFRVAVVNWWVTWPVERVNGVLVSDRLRLGESKRYSASTLVFPESRAESLLRLVDNSPSAIEAVGRELEFPLAWLRNAPPGEEELEKMRRQFPQYIAQEATVRRVAAELQGDEWKFFAVLFRMIDVSSHSLQYQIDFDGVGNDDDALIAAFTETIRPAWRFCDAAIGDLRKTHPDATFVIVSDHGFRFQGRSFNHGSREQGPAPGIFVGAGAGFRKGASVTGASLLDVTPTILRLFGLPVAADMDGRVLEDALDFSKLPALPAVAPSSYDAGWKNEIQAEGVDETELLEDFRALGYIE